MSSHANGLDVDLDAVLDLNRVGDVGIPAGAVLLAFTDAVERDDPDVGAAREALRAVVGDEGVVEAAATIAAFNGLVRVADGTGIRLDDGIFTASIADRARLGIDGYAGAANSAGVTALDSVDDTVVTNLFG